MVTRPSAVFLPPCPVLSHGITAPDTWFGCLMFLLPPYSALNRAVFPFIRSRVRGPEHLTTEQASFYGFFLVDHKVTVKIAILLGFHPVWLDPVFFPAVLADFFQ